MKNLILIDGHALAFRMYFALERSGMKTTRQEPTWAVYGFFKAIFDLLKKQKPDCIAVAFDVGRQTFRVEKYPEYKANRETMPDTLRSQMGLIMKGLEVFNIPIYTKEGYEADDVLGTIAERAKKLGHQTTILTGDQDAFQLADEEGFIKILIPSQGELTEFDWQKVHDKLGIYPNQVADYKGLRGDNSDNIPGIRGIGEKTAASLLTTYSTMENLYEHVDEITQKKLHEKLVDNKETAFLSKYLATINKEVDIAFDFDKTSVEIPEPEKVKEFFEYVQFFPLVKKLPEILRVFNVNLPETPTIIQTQNKKGGEHTQMQLGLPLGLGEPAENKISNNSDIKKKLILTNQALLDLIEELKKVKIFSLDTETTALDSYKARLVGISVGYEVKGELKTAYIPTYNLEGKFLEEEFVLKHLKPILEDTKIEKVLQNAKYELKIFKNRDIDLNTITFDTILAGYIMDSSRKVGLKIQAGERLNFIMNDISELIGKGKKAVTMDTINVETVSAYACDDAWATYKLMEYYKENLNEKELKLLNEVELPLMFVLNDMERTGVSIDVPYLRTLDGEITKKLYACENEIFDMIGIRFNVNSARQTSDVLFNKLKIAPRKKNIIGFSTNAKVLEELAVENPIAQKILDQRHLFKLKSTYVEVLPNLINPIDERIHTAFNQTATTTGRLSSSDPNLQNIPIRTELGNRIRRAFVPKDPKNSVILSADYSQIELRILAHFSQDEILTQAFLNDEDVHTITASKVYDVPLNEVTNEMRYKAKAVNFGLIYGQSRYGLAAQLKITPEEAQIFIDKYFQTYPSIKSYMQNILVAAHQNGYVETLYGRRRYLESELASSNTRIREFAERAAINAPLQGTAADLIKMAMIRLHKQLEKFESKLIIQVHDELVLEVPKTELDEVLKLTKESMELEQPLKVPLKVDIEVGGSWMEA